MAQHIVWLSLELRATHALSTNGEASSTMPILLDPFLWLTAKLVNSSWCLRHTSLADCPPALEKVTAMLLQTHNSYPVFCLVFDVLVSTQRALLAVYTFALLQAFQKMLMGFACLYMLQQSSAFCAVVA